MPLSFVGLWYRQSLESISTLVTSCMCIVRSRIGTQARSWDYSQASGLALCYRGVAAAVLPAFQR